MSPPAAARVVYLDADVFDQINRGNARAAQSLRTLLADPNVKVAVPPWVRRELVDQPEIPRTAVANRLLLAELKMQHGAAPNLAERRHDVAAAAGAGDVLAGGPGESAHRCHRSRGQSEPHAAGATEAAAG